MTNNPAAPYILPIVPTWSNEFSDPALKDVFGPTHQGTSGTYRLDPKEAIVFFGTLPPPGRYTSLQSYVATRQGTFDQSSPAYQALAAEDPGSLNTFFLKIPQKPSRIESFSSVMRYALPNDPNAGNNWRNTLPLSVLRVREHPSSTRAPQPFPTSV